MKLLLDTHYVLEVVGDAEVVLSAPGLLEELRHGNEFLVSIVSIWEAEIKSRLGMLRLLYGPVRWPPLLEVLKIRLLPLETRHVFANIAGEPRHKDPFDRILLGIAAAEGCKLLTKDKQLQNHPLAWHPFLP